MTAEFREWPSGNRHLPAHGVTLNSAEKYYYLGYVYSLSNISPFGRRTWGLGSRSGSGIIPREKKDGLLASGPHRKFSLVSRLAHPSRTHLGSEFTID